MRALVIVFVALAALVFAARADAVERRVAVWVEGVERDALRTEIERAVSSDRSIVEGRAFLVALGRAGQRGPIASGLDATKRTATIDRVVRAARDAGADEVVIVVATRGPKGAAHARVFVVDVASGAVREGETESRRGDGAVGALARANLAPAPPAPPPAPALTPAPPPVLTPAPALTPFTAPDHDAVSSPAGARPPGGELASLALGVEAGGRRLRYVDALTPGLRDYSVAAAPLATVRAALYPLADVSRTVDVGVLGGYARAFGLASSASGASVDTRWWRFHAGGAVRVRTPRVVLAFGGAYAGETFDFGASPIDAQTPAVDYRFVRASVDARVPLGSFALFAGGAYDAVLSAGSVADRFPRAKVGGVEATLGASYRLTRAIEVVASASYRRFFYAMHPVPGDALVAGGALDELYGLQGSVAYAF